MTLLSDIPFKSTVQYNPILTPLYHWESLIGPDSGDNDNSNTCKHNFEDIDLEVISEDVIMVDGTNSFIYYDDNNTLANASQRLRNL